VKTPAIRKDSPMQVLAAFNVMAADHSAQLPASALECFQVIVGFSTG
jgi:hypothetical protein